MMGMRPRTGNRTSLLTEETNLMMQYYVLPLYFVLILYGQYHYVCYDRPSDCAEHRSVDYK